MQLAWLALIGFAAIGWLLGPLNSTCCLVGPNAEYKTIQSAVDAAPSGSTIVVFSGVYSENITINKSVKIFNANHTAFLPLLANNQILIHARDETQPAVNILSPNVTFQGFNVRGGSAGIMLKGHHINIFDNNITNSRTGLLVENAEEIWLQRNNITQQTEFGVHVVDSRHVRLINNTIERNKDGILFEDTERSLLRNNTLRHHEERSITLFNSPDNGLFNNRILNVEGFGLILDHSPQTLMRGNELNAGNRSFWIEASTRADYEHTIDTSNTINNNPMLYLKGLSERRLKPGIQVGYLALIDANDVTISHLNASNVPAGIVLVNANNITIQQTTIDRTRVGVLAQWSSDIYLSDSIITNVTQNAVHVEFSNTTQLARMRIEGSGENAAYVLDSQSFSISESTLARNEIGSVWAENSTDGLLSDNIFNGNGQYAVYLKGTQRLTLDNNLMDGNLTGLYLEAAIGNMFQNNVIQQNQFGIFLKESQGNTITANQITENTRGAIRGIVENNVIEGNVIVELDSSDTTPDDPKDSADAEESESN
jgi:parallel beta-helix repeat protein